MKNNVKICPYCEEEFNAVRLNQNFCCKKHQWTYYNQNKAMNSKLEIRKINSSLRKNYNILRKLIELNSGYDISFPLQKAKKLGFATELYTSSNELPSQNTIIYRIYDLYFYFDKRNNIIIPDPKTLFI